MSQTGAMHTGALGPGELVLDGRFRVERRIGAGGMGEVYLAEQVSLRRRVALKVLRPELSTQPGMADRFHREAQLLASVEHPSVVRVIDFGQSAQGAMCLVMEFVDGVPLELALRRGEFSLERSGRLLLQLAEGLAAIHARGIVHRDLKPANVLLSEGPRGEEARLLDFGIARLAESPTGEASLTQAGMVLGTPEYLSPEQAMGRAVDVRSDLYSFGVLAYRLLAGRLPFPGPSARELLSQHITQLPEPLDAVAPHLAAHPELVTLVASLLAKAPEQRPVSSTSLVQSLALALPGAAARGNTPLPGAQELGGARSTPKPASALASPAMGAASPEGAARAGVSVDIGYAQAAPSAGVPSDAGKPARAASSSHASPDASPLGAPVMTPTAPSPTDAAPGAVDVAGTWVRRAKPDAAHPTARPSLASLRTLSHKTRWAAAALALLAAALFIWSSLFSLERRAERMVEDGRAQEALLLLESALTETDAASAPALVRLKGRALHALDRHAEEIAYLEAAPAEALEDTEPVIVVALAEDLGKSRKGEGVRNVLDRIPRARRQRTLVALAEGRASYAQWGALRYLEGTGEENAVDLVEAYVQALDSTVCGIKGAAAKRLGELGNTAAAGALERVAKTPKKEGILPLFEENCGQDEARAALRKLESAAAK